MIVTFCGHRDIPNSEKVHTWLSRCIERLILDGATKFYLGGYGAFDFMAKSIVWDFKAKYPWIRSILVLPYPDRYVDMTFYNESIYPPLETVPRRYCILRRNQWMVEKSDVIVACVFYSWGGAAATLKYAQRKKKHIIQYQ